MPPKQAKINYTCSGAHPLELASTVVGEQRFFIQNRSAKPLIPTDDNDRATRLMKIRLLHDTLDFADGRSVWDAARHHCASSGAAPARVHPRPPPGRLLRRRGALLHRPQPDLRESRLR